MNLNPRSLVRAIVEKVETYRHESDHERSQTAPRVVETIVYRDFCR